MNELPDIYPMPDIPLVPCPLDFTGMSKIERTTAYFQWITQPRVYPEIKMQSSGQLIQISDAPVPDNWSYKDD